MRILTPDEADRAAIELLNRYALNAPEPDEVYARSDQGRRARMRPAKELEREQIVDRCLKARSKDIELLRRQLMVELRARENARAASTARMLVALVRDELHEPEEENG